MKKSERHEAIENYLKNRLLEAERSAFEAELAADPALAAELEFHRDMIEATKPEALALRDLMEEAYRNYAAESTTESAQTPGQQAAVAVKPVGMSIVSNRRLLWAAAAAVLLGIAVIGFWKPWQSVIEQPVVVQEKTDPVPIDTSKTEKQNPVIPPSPPVAEPDYLALSQTNYEQPGDFGLTLSQTASETRLDTAAAAYRKREYSKVIGLLEGATEEKAIFMRAHAKYQLGRFAAAEKDFDLLQESSEYGYTAEWAAVACALAQMPASKARLQKRLRDIRKVEGHPYGEKARRLQKLDM